MKSLIRKLALTGGAAVILVTAGGTTAHITAHAADVTALHCAIQGTATISPGLSATPQPESFSYTGTAKCNGTLAGVIVNATQTGTIFGSGSCTGGSLATCTQALPPISCAGSDAGASFSANGTYVQAGADITVECSGTDSGGGAVTVEASAVFTPNPPGVQNPLVNVVFTGTASVHSS